MSHLHKRFTSDQVKELLERYLKNEQVHGFAWNHFQGFSKEATGNVIFVNLSGAFPKSCSKSN